MSDNLTPDDKEFWDKAEVIDEKTLNSKEFWAGAKPLTEEEAAVFDERNVRTISLPMSLKGYEVNYMIKRDVDGIKRFWAQQDINELESVWRGIATGTVLNVPQVVGGLMQQIGEAKGKPQEINIPDVLSNVGPNTEKIAKYAISFLPKPIEDFITKYHENNITDDMSKYVVDKLGGYDAIAEQGKSLVKRNKKWLADIGYDRSENHPIIYDLASGAGSLLQSIGLYRITKGAAAPIAFTGAQANAQAYLESRDAGATPDKSSFIAAQRGAVEAALEKFGLDWFMKGIASNTMVKKFAIGFWSEFFQESTQAGAEEGIMQGYGVRDKELKKTFQDILYQGAIGAVVGGGGSVAIGAFVKDQAEQRGVPKDLADKLSTYAQSNAHMIDENLTEFLDKEVSPLVDSDPNSAKFMQLAKNPDLKYEDLDETDKQIYDDFMAAFNSSLKDDTAVSKVEKSFYDMAIENGVREDWAAANSKLIGKYADYAGRALGVSPIEWYQSQGLGVKVDEATGEAAISNASDGDRELNSLRKYAMNIKQKDEKRTERFNARMNEYKRVVKDEFMGDEAMANRAGINKPSYSVSKTKTGIKYPVLNYLKRKGGISPEGTFAKFLKTLDVTPKRLSFAFSKKGADEVDNIPVDEFVSAFGGMISPKESNGYVDLDWLREAVRSEVSGSPIIAQEDIAINKTEQDLDLEVLEADGIDILTMSNDEIRAKYLDNGDVRYQGGNEFDQAGSSNTDFSVDDLKWPLSASDDYMDNFDSIKETANSVERGIEKRIKSLGGTDYTVRTDESRQSASTYVEVMDDNTGDTIIKIRFSDHKVPRSAGSVDISFNIQTDSANDVVDGLNEELNKKLWSRFDQADGTPYSEPTIEVDGVTRSTTNSKGNPIAATKEGLENFWRWFGDSKVVDADGNPLVVYHGTNQNFDNFDTERLGANTGTVSSTAFFFTENPTEAGEYADMSARKQVSDGPRREAETKRITAALAKAERAQNWDLAERLTEELEANELDGIREGDIGANILPVYLSIKDPSTVDANDSIDLHQLRKDMDAAKSSGRDGVKVENAYDPVAERPEPFTTTQWIAFTPTQIKSIHNRGTFSPDDARILYQSNKEALGQTEFFSDGKKLITLFKNANPSTLPHELAHVFLRDMMRVAEVTTRPNVRADWAAIKSFLGVKGNNKLTVAQEEKFARAYEAFLFKGKTEVQEMSSVFERFKAWIGGVYKHITDLNVTLSPQIETVFQKMTGGGYAKTQQEIDKRDATLKKIYEDALNTDFGYKNRNDMLDSVGELATNIGAPLSTRLRAISEDIMHALRRFEFNVRMSRHKDLQKIMPFLDAMRTSKMSKDDYKILDLALKNNDKATVNNILEQYGIAEQFQLVREVIDSLYMRATEANLEIGFIEDYFPRYVNPKNFIDYQSYIYGIDPETYSKIERDMKIKDPQGKMNDEQKAEFINSWLRGYGTNKVNASKKSFEKARSVNYVTAETQHYYDDSLKTLVRYIEGMNERIQLVRFLGKDKDQIEESIGAYTRNLLATKQINFKQEEEIKKVMMAYFNSKGVRTTALASLRDIGYISTMGSFSSTVTQIGDLAFSMYENGFFNTLNGLGRSVVGKQILKKEDLGIEQVAAEFKDEKATSKWVNRVFKLNLMQGIDNINKEAFIASTFKKMQSEASKGRLDLDGVFGDAQRSTQALSDIKEGKLTDDVKYLLFSKLLDYQPISLLEMPEAYVKGGNWRVLYMLKSYTLKQFDVYRREVIWEMKKDPVQGLKNFVALTSFLMLMGMAADEIKDFMFGRTTEFSDRVLINILKIAGVSKYTFYKANREGYLNTLYDTVFLPSALWSPFDTLIRDVQSAMKDNKPKTIEDFRIWSQVPLVGKFYFFWFGGGKDD